MRFSLTAFACALTMPLQAQAFFGTEIAPLLQLVSGQVSEIEKLTQSVKAVKDQAALLRELNAGVDRAIYQIRSIEAIVDRTQGLDPKSVQSLSDLNDLLHRANQNKADIEDLMQARVFLADQAIATSALQGDTAYKMGQEMVLVGTKLSAESATASPGRASQIAAAADSSQMLATGVQLQTMSQMVQLQAMSLEFQKSQMEGQIRSSKMQRRLFEMQLSKKRKRRL